MNRIATHIRRLLLEPKPTYSVADAATLLGMKQRDVHGWMAGGEVEGVDTPEGLVLPWAELVSSAMDFWDQADVEAALGAELADVLPELLRLNDLAVRIPRLEIETLERIAIRDGRSVDAVLARELRDLVSAESAWLSIEIPGFAQALNWP